MLMGSNEGMGDVGDLTRTHAGIAPFHAGGGRWGRLVTGGRAGPGRRFADVRDGIIGARRGGGVGVGQYGDGDADVGGHGDGDGDGHRRRRLERDGAADVHGEGGPGRGAPFHRRPHRARG